MSTVHSRCATREARHEFLVACAYLLAGLVAAWWGSADIDEWGVSRFGVGLLVAGTFTVMASGIWVLAGIIDFFSDGEPVLAEADPAQPPFTDRIAA